MQTTSKTTGIILKISDTPGKDKLIYVLSGNGLFTAFMTPKRNVGKKSFAVDLFTVGEFIYYTTANGNNLINSITPDESFYKIREDIVCLSAAVYFANLAIHASADADMSFAELYSLIIAAFKALSEKQNVKMVKPVFELKIIQLLGFTPCLEADKKSMLYYFDPSDGRLYADNISDGWQVPRSVVLKMYNILNNSDFKNVFYTDEFEYTDIMYYTCQQYLLYHLERDFDSLVFLNGVI